MVEKRTHFTCNKQILKCGSGYNELSDKVRHGGHEKFIVYN